MDTALITGATSGIGYALAHLMAERGHNLVIAARSTERLKQVQAELSGKYSITVDVVTADLSKQGSAEQLYKNAKGLDVSILVNNAGAGLKGNFFDNKLEESQHIAHLNMQSLMELTYYFGNDFRTKKHGKILNIASIVAFFPGPNQPIYYATKSFVRSFSRALAYNLRGSGVTVTAVHPGITKTNFFNAADASEITSGAPASDVALTAYNAMMAGKIEVTHGFVNKLLTNVFARFIPYCLQPAIIDRASDV